MENNSDNNNKMTFEEFKFRRGHYDTLMKALLVSLDMGNLVWVSNDDEKKAYDVLDIYQFALAQDKERPLSGTQFYMVSREGAIGLSDGLEFRVKWILIPMEPSKERAYRILRLQEKIEEMRVVEQTINVSVKKQMAIAALKARAQAAQVPAMPGTTPPPVPNMN